MAGKKKGRKKGSRKKGSRKQRGRTAQQKRFGEASRACMKTSETWPTFGKCMKKAL